MCNVGTAMVANTEGENILGPSLISLKSFDDCKVPGPQHEVTACKVQGAVNVVVLCIIHTLTAAQHHDWPQDPLLCPPLFCLTSLHRSFQSNFFAKEVCLELGNLTKRNTARVNIPVLPCGVDSTAEPQS